MGAYLALIAPVLRGAARKSSSSASVMLVDTSRCVGEGGEGGVDCEGECSSPGCSPACSGFAKSSATTASASLVAEGRGSLAMEHTLDRLAVDLS